MTEYFDHKICRVLVRDDGTVCILCVGGIDAPDISGAYSGVNELPDWVQDKLVVLMICDPTPPTKQVSGVGRRINTNTFWIDVDGTIPPDVRVGIGNLNNLQKLTFGHDQNEADDKIKGMQITSGAYHPTFYKKGNF